jgi:hypothetical protein
MEEKVLLVKLFFLRKDLNKKNLGGEKRKNERKKNK